MAHKLFECSSCSYNIFIEDVAKDPDFCPFCRGLMSFAGGEGNPEGRDYKCGECGYAFRVPASGQQAYKCAKCNYTFPNEPGRKVNHKL